MKLDKALEKLRKDKERKFDQTVDLIVNFKGVDLRKDAVNIVINLPNKIKEKKVAAFFKEKSKLVDTITEPEFKKYGEKTALKNIVKKYDFFIAEAGLMPKVATNFGKVLGPAGKMPSPQLGILGKVGDAEIKEVLDRIEKSLKIRAKEASVKVAVGKQSMKDEEIMENIQKIYEGIVKTLPAKRDNLKNVMVKLTMSKPIKVEIK